ncbi:MAG: CsbD family protein [Candidatus Acidiferrales bacterium]
MKRSSSDKAKGSFHEVKGKIKEKVGRATNNPRLEAEGRAEKIGGKAQRKIGQVEKLLGG